MKKGLIFIISGISFLLLGIVLTTTYDINIKYNFLNYIILVFAMVPIWIGVDFCRKSVSKKKIKKKKKRTNQYRTYGILYSISRPLFVYCKKHYCPKCASHLSTKTKIKFVDSRSPEAINYDFSLGDDVELRTVLFLCNVCNLVFEVDEIWEYEKNNKKRRKDKIKFKK